MIDHSVGEICEMIITFESGKVATSPYVVATIIGVTREISHHSS